MIFQMHFQDRQNLADTEFVGQSDDLETAEQMHEWIGAVKSRHELPEGKQWLVCDETASCFTFFRITETPEPA